MKMQLLKGFIALVPVFIAACGGGGGSDGPAAPQDQTISFTTTGTVSGAAGTTVTNTASGGAGTGAITYASNNITVATVNATTGVATLNAVGTATITAIKSASSGFNQATASYTLNVTQGTQTIAFAQAGPLAVLKGLSVTNTASGGGGTGAISYASSDPSIATVVSSSGLVVGIAAGTTTITATKAADTNYAQAQTTYTVNVQTQATLSAWIGANDTQVTLPTIANGSQFIRSRDRNCNIANYALCISGQANAVNGTVISDTAATINNTGYYVLQGSGGVTNAAAISTKRFSGRIGHTALFFNNRYWVIGGAFETTQYANAEVWSSVDGKTWELETSSAPFGRRWLHQSVVYNNKMWVIGGAVWNTLSVPPAAQLVSDVWSSTDGINWTQVASSTPLLSNSPINTRVTTFNGEMIAVVAGAVYSSTNGSTWAPKATNVPVGGTNTTRAYASLNVYANKLWYIGGAPGFATGPSTGTGVNEVWTSSDAANWTQITATGPTFSPRFRHAAFVLNNRLWVFGGQTVTNGSASPSTTTPDAWSTTDGLTWTQESTNTELDRSYFVESIQQTNKVTLISGVSRGYSHNVYQSTDGNNWIELSPFAQFPARALMKAVSFQGDLWVIGGATLSASDTNDIWRSSDGVNWTKVATSGAIFSPRDSHQVLVYNNRLWVIGGWDNYISAGGTETYLNDVWSSADGVTWRQETAAAPFAKRIHFGATVFNNLMWVIGGRTSSSTTMNDVWSSSDGVNWNLVAVSPPFSARNGHTVVAFNNAMWLIGGGTTVQSGGGGGSVSQEVWTSTNGVTWAIVPPALGSSIFSARAYHGSVVYNNRLWVIAGSSGAAYPTVSSPASSNYNDVWSTADGTTWTRNTPAASFGPRYIFGVTTHNDELWVIGGVDFGRYNDVWRSTDGANWRVGYQQTFTAP